MAIRFPPRLWLRGVPWVSGPHHGLVSGLTLNPIAFVMGGYGWWDRTLKLRAATERAPHTILMGVLGQQRARHVETLSFAINPLIAKSSDSDD